MVISLGLAALLLAAAVLSVTPLLGDDGDERESERNHIHTTPDGQTIESNRVPRVDPEDENDDNDHVHRHLHFGTPGFKHYRGHGHYHRKPRWTLIKYKLHTHAHTH